MKTSHRVPAHTGLFAASLLLLVPAAQADLSDPRILSQLALLERTAALANQAAYNALTSGPSAVCVDENAGPSGGCSGAVFQIFDNVRELVHTANELDDGGPTRFSLGLDIRGLGAALRWTAAEELAAQRSAATEFSNSQLGALAGRLAALRFGALGAHTLQFRQEYGSIVEFSGDLPLHLGDDEDESSIARRFSAFVNGSFGSGNKRDTTFRGGYEDAFDFKGVQGALGVDYRLSPRAVFGALLGFANREIDFDSRASVVDGRIDSEGGSVTLYGQWEFRNAYVSASVGRQRLTHKIERRITYPSLNPLVPAVDSTAFGRATSNGFNATFDIGYDIRRAGLTLEPYIRSELQAVLVEPFSEVDTGGFAFQYSAQRITSLDSAFGAKLQQVWTPPFGVVVPYLRGEYHREMMPGPRKVSAVYTGLGALGSQPADFSVPTDRPDRDYFQFAAGVSVVAPHGLQGFLQYQQAVGLRPFTNRAITGGLRLEF